MDLSKKLALHNVMSKGVLDVKEVKTIFIQSKERYNDGQDQKIHLKMLFQ